MFSSFLLPHLFLKHTHKPKPKKQKTGENLIFIVEILQYRRIIAQISGQFPNSIHIHTTGGGKKRKTAGSPPLQLTLGAASEPTLSMKSISPRNPPSNNNNNNNNNNNYTGIPVVLAKKKKNKYPSPAEMMKNARQATSASSVMSMTSQISELATKPQLNRQRRGVQKSQGASASKM